MQESSCACSEHSFGYTIQSIAKADDEEFTWVWLYQSCPQQLP